jgi:malate permease and related proteins
MLQSLLSIFANTILPIFAVAGVGFWLARSEKVEARIVSRITFSVLSPCLVFNALVTADVSAAEFGRMAFFAACLMLGGGLLAWLASVVMRLDRPTGRAFIGVAMFANAGNYGLPLVLFAFGQAALTRATIYFVIHLILLYSLGIVVMSSSQKGPREALLSMVRIPHLYAIVAALAFMLLKVPVPTLVLRPVGLLANAALPMMILLLGMQLERAAMPERPALVGLATAGRLVILPALALGLAALMGLTGVERQAAVIEASMPAAVMMTVLAMEYQAAPAFVNAVVFVSTIVSPITLTILVALLQS